MFEDDDLDLDFGDSLLESLTTPKSNPSFKPKFPTNSRLRNSNHPTPAATNTIHNPPISITKLSAPFLKPSAPSTRLVALSTEVSKPSSTNILSPSTKISSAPFKLLNSSTRTSSNSPRLSSHPYLSQNNSSINPLLPCTSSPNPVTIISPPVSSTFNPVPHQVSSGLSSPLVRLFPGPAGLMPKISPGVHRPVQDHEVEEQRRGEEEGEECEGVGECVAWLRARQELGMIDKDSLVDKFNTKWIKEKSSAGTTKKMPFFLCKIGKLDMTCVDPMVMLVDVEGKVEGSMHRDVVEQFGKEVRVGSVLVLQRVAVLVTARKEYVNITLNNLVSIYTKNNVKHVKTVSKDDMIVVARELERVREQQMRSILGGETQLSPTAPPQSLPPAWSSPQVRTQSNSRLPLLTLQMPPPPQSQPPISHTSSPQLPKAVPSKFTFRSLPSQPAPALPSLSSQLPSQAQSQHLVASLLSDLDTSDIWSDF